MRAIAIATGFVLVVSSAPNSRAQVPDSIAAAPGEAPIVTIHAEGAQITSAGRIPAASSPGSSASRLRHS
jgi:hypothetical protein